MNSAPELPVYPRAWSPADSSPNELRAVRLEKGRFAVEARIEKVKTAVTFDHTGATKARVSSSALIRVPSDCNGLPLVLEAGLNVASLEIVEIDDDGSPQGKTFEASGFTPEPFGANAGFSRLKLDNGDATPVRVFDDAHVQQRLEPGKRYRITVEADAELTLSTLREKPLIGLWALRGGTPPFVTFDIESEAFGPPKSITFHGDYRSKIQDAPVPAWLAPFAKSPVA